MFSINEDQTIWLALIGSLLIHGLVFIFSGKTFIQFPRYSVQASAQMVEVSIEEMKSPQDVLEYGNKSMKTAEKINKAKPAVHSKSGVITKASPDYFQNPPPEYPEFAKQMRQEGLVMLSVDVKREGDPVSVVIIQSSGFHLLDQAALNAVKHWKFQPGRIGDIAVESTVTVPIRFSLER